MTEPPTVPARTGDAVLNRLRDRLLAGAAPTDVLKAILDVAAARKQSPTAGLGRSDAERSALIPVVTTQSTGGIRFVAPPAGYDTQESACQFPRSVSGTDLWLAHEVTLHTGEDFERSHACAHCRPRLARAGIDRVAIVPTRRTGRLRGAFLLAALAEQIAARRRAVELGQTHTELRPRSLGLVTAEPWVDRFPRHTLLAIVERLGALGGTVWLPIEGSPGCHSHRECVGGCIRRATESAHPAGRRGRLSPTRRAVLTDGQIEEIPPDARRRSQPLRGYEGASGAARRRRSATRADATW